MVTNIFCLRPTIVIFWLSFLYGVTSHAQFLSATIQIDGLTCSMCSYGVEKSIRKLVFVEKISIDLNQNIAFVEFREGSTISIKDLTRSVRAAGFSVRSLIIDLKLEKPIERENPYVIFDSASCFLLGVMKDIPSGVVRLELIDPSFSDSKLYNRFKHLIGQGSSVVTSDAYYFAIL